MSFRARATGPSLSMRRYVRVVRFGRVRNTPGPAAGFNIPRFGRKALLGGVDLSISGHSRAHGTGDGWQCPALIAVEFAKHRLEGCR